MKIYGRSAVAEFLSDRIVYRSLEALDPGLPRFAQAAALAGLPPETLPRKSEPAYAGVVVQLLHAARRLEAPEVRLERLIFVGDTRMNDSTAFANLCQAGGWRGLAFIGADRMKEPAGYELASIQGGALYLANRWDLLADFDRYCAVQEFGVDEATAVVVDLDKTALGGRGRNDQVIDQARVTAVRRTVAGLLGEAYNPAAFQAAYDLLKQMEFHPFTADNQDYLAYICLVLGSGLYALDQVVDEVRAGVLTTFRQFINRVDEGIQDLPPGLAQVHTEIYTNVRQGDPTPFKPFRRNEYLETVGRLGHLPDSTPLETLLAEEIVLTQEVRHWALEWRQRGALLFGLSDKPDEASLPTPELAALGYRGLHAVNTHAVGV